MDQLRAGVSSREVARVLPLGREGLLGRIREDLERIARGEDPKPGYRILLADYGQGKTHTLQAAWSLAEDLGFVVSHLTVSREATLDRPDRLYRKLLQDTYVPGHHEPGIAPLLDALSGRSEEAQRLLRFVEKELHPKLSLVLEARLEDEDGDTDILDQDLSGFFPPVADIRRAYRERHGQAPKVDRFRLVDHSFDYFRLLDRLAVSAGYAGWVVLIDEFEIVGRFGRRGRALSYDFFRRLALDRELPHTLTLWAVAASFKTDTIEGKGEAERLPEWLRERGQNDLAQRIRRPLSILSGEAALPPLREEDLRRAFSTIREAHGTAYGWEPPAEDLYDQVRRHIPERDRKIRHLVRAAVQVLDLQLSYGQVEDLFVEEVEEPPQTLSDDDEPPEGEGVSRAWPDD